MDNIARNAMLAKQAGVSYGKWMAMQEPVKVTEKSIPEGWVKCECCGKPFKKSHGKRFCDIECRRKAYEAKAKVIHADYYRRTKAKMKSCPQCP